MARFQVDELPDAPRRAVAPVQGDTFVRPPAVPNVSKNTKDLASALGSFSGALGGLIQERDKEAKQRAEDLAKGTIANKTRKQYIKEVQAGTLPNYGDPFSQAVYAKQYGEYQADIFKEKFEQRLEGNVEEGTPGFDWREGDVDQLFTESVSPLYERMSEEHPAARATFNRAVQKYREKLLKRQHEVLQETAEEEQQDAAFNVFRKRANTLLSPEEGPPADPETLHRELRKLYSELGPGTPNNRTYSELDREVLNLAGQLAETHPAHAIELIRSKRIGKDGEPIPSIASKKKHRDQVRSIAKQVQSTIIDQTKEKVKDKTDELNLKAATTKETGPPVFKDVSVPLPNGEEYTYTVEQQRRAAAKALKAYSDRQTRKLRESPTQRINREIDLYSTAGLKNPDWTQRFDDLPSLLTAQNLSNPEIRKRILADANLYGHLRSKSKFAARSHIGSEAEKFLDLYWVARDITDSDEQALDAAFRVYEPLTKENADVLGRSGYEAVERSLQTQFNSGYWPFSSSPENQSAIFKKLRETSRLYSDLGLSPEEAVTKASENIRKRYVNINGWYTEIPEGYSGDKFTETVEVFIEDFAENNDIIENADDIGVDFREGVATLVDKGSGIAVTDDDGKIARFTAADLEEYQSAVNSQTAAELRLTRKEEEYWRNFISNTLGRVNRVHRLTLDILTKGPAVLKDLTIEDK
jgi:hypothetical protein